MTPRLRAAILRLTPAAARALAAQTSPDAPTEPALLAHALRRVPDVEILATAARSRRPDSVNLLEQLTGLPASRLLVPRTKYYFPRPARGEKMFL